jgi:predicted transcriptional regulator
LYDSRLRLAILDALKDGPLRLADLRRVVNANAPNTSSKSKELEGMGLVERVEGDFQLTPFGRAVMARTQESLEFYSTYEKFKDFWSTHEVDAIPEHLWSRIGELSDAELIGGSETNPDRSHEFYISSLANVRKFMYGIAPVYHEDYLVASSGVVERGADIQIVVSKDIAEHISKLPEYQKKYFTKGIHLFLAKEPLNVAFTVTEGFISLAIKAKDKPVSFTYADSDLVSTDPRAIRWGLDLFEYYKKQAKPVNLKDYL